MLNYECRKILKILNKLNANGVTSVNFFDIVNYFPKKKQGRIALRLGYILPYLKDNGYITYSNFDNKFSNVRVTYTGLARKLFSIESIKTWICSNAIAILSLIVSIIALIKSAN